MIDILIHYVLNKNEINAKYDFYFMCIKYSFIL